MEAGFKKIRCFILRQAKSVRVFVEVSKIQKYKIPWKSRFACSKRPPSPQNISTLIDTL
jgi:hypothetical protein